MRIALPCQEQSWTKTHVLFSSRRTTTCATNKKTKGQKGGSVSINLCPSQRRAVAPTSIQNRNRKRSRHSALDARCRKGWGGSAPFFFFTLFCCCCCMSTSSRILYFAPHTQQHISSVITLSLTKPSLTLHFLGVLPCSWIHKIHWRRQPHQRRLPKEINHSAQIPHLSQLQQSRR